VGSTHQGDDQEPNTDILTWAAKEYIANKCKSLISAHPSDSTQIVNIVTVHNNDDVTIAMSNCSPAATAQHAMSAQLAS
jgi:hypothetical protein